MKIALWALILCGCNSAFAQSVRIKGVVRNSFNSAVPINISVNDTIGKIFMDRYKAVSVDEKKRGDSLYNSISNNKNLYFNTSESGKFQMLVKKTDTLYFSYPGELTQKHAVADLMKQRNIVIQLKRRPCELYVPCNDSITNKHYAFIAEKVSLKALPIPFYCDGYNTDGEYIAVYKIVKNVYGNYKKDTITFSTYDHYGTPGFSDYKYVMLFVSEHCGKLYHDKYQYYDVYKTKDGRWASPGDPYRFDKFAKERNIKAVIINFANDLHFYPGKIYDMRYGFPKYEEPYFKVIGIKAIPLMGAYVEDLFSLKKRLILKDWK